MPANRYRSLILFLLLLYNTSSARHPAAAAATIPQRSAHGEYRWPPLPSPLPLFPYAAYTLSTTSRAAFTVILTYAYAAVARMMWTRVSAMSPPIPPPRYPPTTNGPSRCLYTHTHTYLYNMRARSVATAHSVARVCAYITYSWDNSITLLRRFRATHYVYCTVIYTATALTHPRFQ